MTETSISRRLAALAHQAAAQPDLPRLRAILAHNLTLATSPARPAERLVLPGESGPVALAGRLAAQIYARAQDDWFDEGRCHIAPMVIAAALASGTDDLYAAVAAGYAAEMPVAATYGLQAHKQGFRPTSMFGNIGAAAAASVGLGLDAAQTARAISLAANASAGHTRCMIEETDEWRLDLIRAARAGIEAALLVQLMDATAADHSFEGQNGWAQSYFDDRGAQRLNDTLASRVFDLKQVGLKPYPASGVGFATIDAALKMRADLGGAPADDARISLFAHETVWLVPGAEARGPYRSLLGAALSLPCLAAQGLLTGTVVPLIGPDLPADIARVIAATAIHRDNSLPPQVARMVLTQNGKSYEVMGDGDALMALDFDSITADPAGFALRFGVTAADVSRIITALPMGKVSASAAIAALT
ncbi:MmgE/PrpD family protein [Ketogulonicigenium vulgare]|uniref:MmgE/PrpD family protein n=1 Tax=Ketogulonicigenium vulgare TaxID=92945 RepID=UPI00235A2CA8|nr:MmgE/PrpD family protein [Ketogulonicigenium vulgare]